MLIPLELIAVLTAALSGAVLGSIATWVYFKA